MSLAPRTSDGIAVESFETVRRAFEVAPLNAAPSALRPAVWRLWTLTAHLFPNPLPLAAAVGLWVRDYGLTEDDATAILAGFTSPARQCEFRFASDLMTALATEAGRAIHKRKREAEAKARADEAPAVDVAMFREWLGKFESNFPRPEDVL
jgi:hypothetical protein